MVPGRSVAFSSFSFVSKVKGITDFFNNLHRDGSKEHLSTTIEAVVSQHGEYVHIPIESTEASERVRTREKRTDYRNVIRPAQRHSRSVLKFSRHRRVYKDYHAPYLRGTLKIVECDF